MRITFVAPVANLAGGIRVLAIYADRLQKRGHEVSVVSLPKRRATFREQARSLLSGHGLISLGTRQESHFDAIDVPHLILERCRPVAERDVPDADVVVASWWETAEWVSGFPARKGAKVHFVQHHETFDYLPRERVVAAYALPLHKITISRWLVDVLQRTYGFAEVALVPNSVDTSQFHAPPRGRQPVPTVGFLYSPTPWKGSSVVAKALALARRRTPELRAIAFGLDEPSSDVPLPEGTEFVRRPAQDHLRTLYARCDVWLCGSESEGFHLPPLEAMACRCPVVSTAVGGPADVVVEGMNGHLVPVGDAEALAARLQEVLALPDPAWRAMSDAAYACATGYTWDDATARFEGALESAVERTRVGA